MANLRRYNACFSVTVWKLMFSLQLIPLISVSSDQCRPLQTNPSVDPITYSQMKDVNIGVFMRATRSNGSARCHKTGYPGSFVIEHSEAVAFAVKSINEASHLLPNVTLGFIQVNDCSNDRVALATALAFLPRISYEVESTESCTKNSSSFFEKNLTTSEMPFYDVVGVLGPMSSSSTVAVSKLFTSVNIPIIGCLSTGDELSDKVNHPYFLRVIPSDRYQVDAMVNFIQKHNWSYISVVYIRASFGEKGFDRLKERSTDSKFCIAASHRISEDSADYDAVVEDLLSYHFARVVVLFLYDTIMVRLFTSVNKFNATGHFIWLRSDTWSSAYRGFTPEMAKNFQGLISFTLYSKYVQGYLNYLSHIRVNETKNPWFKFQWEDLTGCSLDGNKSCDPNLDIVNTDKFGFEKTTSLYIDAVYAFAHAIHNLLTDTCPMASGPEARRCIKGDILLDYLKNVSFQGDMGRIEFNPSGDIKGKVDIQQMEINTDTDNKNSTSLVDLEGTTVAIYDIATMSINFTDTKPYWGYLKIMDRMVPLPIDDPFLGIPESVCSRPCVPGEFKIQKEPLCCWECRKCRENEIVTKQGTSCQACGLFTWPNANSNYTSCQVIPPTYPLLTDTLPVLLICLALGAIICASLVVIGYIYFRDTRVIKASSRELSITQMVAIFVGYVTVIVFQTPPTHGTCGALYFLFCLSFGGLYAPLLVKAVRIFRIFYGATKHNQRPRFVSPRSQIVITSVLVGIQMLLCVFIYVTFRPSTKSNQPVPTEPFVELFCTITLPGLASFLTYNLLLVFLCSVLAFKTRQLPDNFNESKFISMCVSTTLVIWLAFIPTYFTAALGSTRVMLLSIALLLNHTVALIFLFFPKIYAAVCLPPENFVTSRFQTGNTPTQIFAKSGSNRVLPVQEMDYLPSKPASN